MLTVTSVLKTLRRVDDRIILAVVGRDIDLGDGATCLCGWFVREKLAEVRNVGASRVRDLGWKPTLPSIVKFFGGDREEWNAVFLGVCDDYDMPIIEAAFVRRVNEAVFGRGAR